MVIVPEGVLIGNRLGDFILGVSGTRWVGSYCKRKKARLRAWQAVVKFHLLTVVAR